MSEKKLAPKNRLKAYREKYGYTLEDVAGFICGVEPGESMTKSAVRMHENGQRNISAAALRKYAKLYVTETGGDVLAIFPDHDSDPDDPEL